MTAVTTGVPASEVPGPAPVPDREPDADAERFLRRVRSCNRRALSSGRLPDDFDPRDPATILVLALQALRAE